MLKLTLTFTGIMISATVALLIYSVVVDDPIATCREFTACGGETPTP